VPLWQGDTADAIEQVSTEEARAMALRLAQEEGLFAGLSTGANVIAALRLAESLKPGATVVSVMCDTGIQARFAACAAAGRAALVTYVTAGDPDFDTGSAILNALPAAGADIIELGVPFTDPMADGVPVQARRAARAQGRADAEEDARHGHAFRKEDNATPIVLMGYYNPIYIYGVDAFLADAKRRRRRRADRRRPAAGRGRELCLPALKARAELHPPGDADHRRQAPAGGARRTPRASSTTSRSPASPAARSPNYDAVGAAVARIKRHTELPVAVGFGVKTPEDARAIAKGADGVVVGSALVERVRQPRRRWQGHGKDGFGCHLAGRRARGRRPLSRESRIASGYFSLRRESASNFWAEQDVVRKPLRTFRHRPGCGLSQLRGSVIQGAIR
jgi:tryptophan synthase alpha chain